MRRLCLGELMLMVYASGLAGLMFLSPAIKDFRKASQLTQDLSFVQKQPKRANDKANLNIAALEQKITDQRSYYRTKTLIEAGTAEIFFIPAQLLFGLASAAVSLRVITAAHRTWTKPRPGIIPNGPAGGPS